MASNPFRVLLLMVSGIFVVLCFNTHTRVYAQKDTPSWNVNRTKPSPTPTRKPIKTSHPRPAPVRHPAPTQPLLSVQFRVFKVNDDNSEVEVSPTILFHKGDRIRIAMKSDQNVYLYVIRQSSPNSHGELVFPDSRFNSGQNFLKKGIEVKAPSGCPAGTAPQLCSYVVDGEVGKEVFTMVFTRNSLFSLLESGTGTDNSQIKPQALAAYVSSLHQQLSVSESPGSPFGKRIRNTNPKTNDKIVVLLPLNKGG